MLVIRNAQMHSFQEARRDSFERDLARHIAQNFRSKYLELTNKGKDETSVRQLIHDAIERAFKYGITAEPDVRHFVEMTFTIGADFESQKEWQWPKRFWTMIPCRGTRKSRSSKLTETRPPIPEWAATREIKILRRMFGDISTVSLILPIR